MGNTRQEHKFLIFSLWIIGFGVYVTLIISILLMLDRIKI